MKCWRLRIDSMSGIKGFHTMAFMNGVVAKMYAEDLDEEWTSYIQEETIGEKLEGDYR